MIAVAVALIWAGKDFGFEGVSWPFLAAANLLDVKMVYIKVNDLRAPLSADDYVGQIGDGSNTDNTSNNAQVYFREFD
jgi:hypothetical protein